MNNVGYNKIIHILPADHSKEHDAEEVMAFVRECYERRVKATVMVEFSKVECFDDILGSETPGELAVKIENTLPDFRPWTKSIFNALAEIKKSPINARIYPIDADQNDPRLGRKWAEVRQLAQFACNSTGDERIPHIIKFLKSDREFNISRHKIMLENVEDILESPVEGPFLIVVGTFHAVYLKKALEGSGNNNVRLVRPISEEVDIEIEAGAQASEQKPDLNVIKHYIKIIDGRENAMRFKRSEESNIIQVDGKEGIVRASSQKTKPESAQRDCS